MCRISSGTRKGLKMNQDIKILHVGLSVNDMEESIAWYQDVLGFEKVSDDYIPPLQCRIVFLQHDDFKIELFKHDESLPIPAERLHPNSDIQTIGTKHMCLSHPDVTGLFADLKEKGVKIALGPQTMGEDVMGYINDPNGILIEFIQQ